MTIRVLVVDDSATMRGLITATLQRDPQITVIGQACDPIEARKAIKELNPDVITLDIEMPNMNGLDFLEKIMRLRPTPVIMISTLTQDGAEANLRALEIGAFDCIGKSFDNNGFDQLAEKVRMAAQSRVRARMTPFKTADRSIEFTPKDCVIAIGSSTGGVEALLTILSRFPANCPPTLITQHMPAVFTTRFAERLNRLCGPDVSEAVDGGAVQSGHIYLAPGGAHLELINQGKLRCRLTESERVSGHRPSVDVLFSSVARAVGSRALGIILTGMGRDGAQGLLEMRQAGAQTLGQDEATCVVYGMPKVAFEIGAVMHQAGLEKIADRILQHTSAQPKERA
jgi:two-component system chemotaxis response regulator CheB